MRRYIFSLPVYTIAGLCVIFHARAQQENLALNRPVVASSMEGAGLEAGKVNDGLIESRWGSHFEDNEWIYIELNAVYAVHRVVLNWETAYGKSYNIDVSFNGIDWETVFEERSGDGSIDVISFEAPADAQYVRMTGLERGTVFGFSLWEFEIYGFDLTDRYVETGGTDTGNNCLDENAPCATITRAIEASRPGNTINIGAGSYTESISVNRSVNLHGAGESSTFLQAHAQPAMADSRIVTIPPNVLVNIRNLTIRHGHVTGGGSSGRGGGIRITDGYLILDHVTLHRNEATYGGGIHNSGGELVLRNVTFSENTANNQGQGGGMYNFNSSPDMKDVIFKGNTANSNGGGMSNSGNSAPTLSNVSFINNTANNAGGGIRNTEGSAPRLTNVKFNGNKARIGGGLYNNNSAPVLSGVEFIGNQADTLGGGLANVNNSLPVLTHVVFSNNSAVHYGGAVSNISSSPAFISIIFNGNSAEYGGAINNSASSPDFLNVTVSHNAAGTHGGGIYNTSNSLAILRNSIIWNNTAGDAGHEIFNDGTSSTALHFSIYKDEVADIEGGDFHADTNSSTADPLFVDGSNGDFHLEDGSPAINAGDPGTDTSGFSTTGGAPVDIEGNVRVQDDRIDLGVYESVIVTGLPDEVTGTEKAGQFIETYPNPFNSVTNIRFRISDSGYVTLSVYDLLGNEVATLVAERRNKGDHAVAFDASGIPGGIYFCKLLVESRPIQLKRMIFAP